jgi:hypothetical protein
MRFVCKPAGRLSVLQPGHLDFYPAAIGLLLLAILVLVLL